MQFYRRVSLRPRRLAILSGTFNPPTVAHLALGRAALAHAGEVLFALPRVLPHKQYDGVSFQCRIELLQLALASEPAFSIAAPEGGLFAEIAEECRAAYGDDVRLLFLCGRDAAERVAGWNYGREGAFREMLDRFELVVAARRGEYRVPDELRDRIHTLTLPPCGFDDVSATAVRDRICRGVEWRHLVPDVIVEQVARLYGRG